MRTPILVVVPFLIPFRMRGQSLGPLVLLHRRALRDLGARALTRLVAHELVHFDQWRSLGAIRFVIEYARGWVAANGVYARNPMEATAWRYESDKLYLARAKALLEARGLMPAAATVRA